MDEAEIKAILRDAATFEERIEAVTAASNLGMPLHEIEEYLDWLDMTQSRDQERARSSSVSNSAPRQPPSRSTGCRPPSGEAGSPDSG
jgi:DNA-binding transcriptional MerR regulator